MMKIAKYALTIGANCVIIPPMDTIRHDLKTMNRQFQLAITENRYCNNLIALQEQSFPVSASCLTVLYAVTAPRSGWILHMISGIPIAFAAAV